MHRFIKKYPEFSAVSLLVVFCLLFLCFGLNFYPIIDTQETFFASLPKNIFDHDNYKVLMLNLQPLIQNPPFYLWFITQPIKLFKVLSEISVRLPSSIISSIFIFFLYYMGKTVVSRKFGFASAIILLTSLSYIIFSHFAITDISFIFFVTVALYLVFYASFKPETSKMKPILWLLFYLFCGLACLIKGLAGIVVPLAVIFVYYYLIGKFKDIFNPLFLIPGTICFLIVTIPWYFAIYNIFGADFLKTSIFVYDFSAFINNICYLAILLLPAFLPWSVIFAGFLCSILKKLFLRFRNHAKFKAITKEQKIVVFGFTYFIATLFLAASITKSVFSILFIIPSASILTAYFLCENYVKENSKAKILTFSTYILAILFTVSTISFSIFYMFLPLNIFNQSQQFVNLMIIGANFVSILLLLKLKNKNLFSTLFTYILSMSFILIFTVAHGFNMFYLSGENEIIKFSKYIKTKDSTLIVYNLPIKYETFQENANNVLYIDKSNISDIGTIFKNSAGKICYLILKNKDIYLTQGKISQSLFLIEKGEKYSIYSNVNLPKKALSLTKFYNE